tara:strand:- start:132 stop:395 length:264 start_codon:yes stop_codon:yes gene_type:complete
LNVLLITPEGDLFPAISLIKNNGMPPDINIENTEDKEIINPYLPKSSTEITLAKKILLNTDIGIPKKYNNPILENNFFKFNSLDNII